MPSTNLQASLPTAPPIAPDASGVDRPCPQLSIVNVLLPIIVCQGVASAIAVWIPSIRSQRPDMILCGVALDVLIIFESIQESAGRTTPLAAFLGRLYRTRYIRRSQALPKPLPSPSDLYLYPIKRLVAATLILTVILGMTLYVLNEANNWDDWNRSEAASDQALADEQAANAADAKTVALLEKQQAAKAILAKSRVHAAGNTTCEPHATH